MLSPVTGLPTYISPILPFLFALYAGTSKYPFLDVIICCETAVDSHPSHPAVFLSVVPVKVAFTMFVQMTGCALPPPEDSTVVKVKSAETARFPAKSFDFTR